MAKKKLTRFDELIIKDFTFASKSKLAKIIIEEEIKQLEDVRMHQHIIMENEVEYYRVLNNCDVANGLYISQLYEDALMLPMTIGLISNGVKVTINDFLPSLYLKKASVSAGYFAEKWRKDIGTQLKQFCNEYKIFYDKIYVILKSYVPFINDFDNKFYKPIFDGLVRSGIVINDDSYSLTYAIKMEVETQNPKTEIYIFGN